jgi:hypothetical protein
LVSGNRKMMRWFSPINSLFEGACRSAIWPICQAKLIRLSICLRLS